MFNEFKNFITKRNVVDLAVGVVIGASTSKVVGSLVSDVVMPPVGLLLGRVDFSNLFITLSGQSFETVELAKKAGAVTINYGLFVNTLIDFAIIAFIIFLIIHYLDKLKKKEQLKTKTCPFCKSKVNLDATRCSQCTSNL